MATPYAKLLGLILIIVGVLGFVPGLAANGMLLGVFMVSGVHNVVHLASGLVLAWAGFAGGAEAARKTVFGFGAIYALVTVLGIVMNGNILGVLTVNTADNVLHAVIAVVSLAVALGRRPAEAVAAKA